MTDDEIRKLEANRETDALVAERVMRGRRVPGDMWLIPKSESDEDGSVFTILPHYSTDIAAAWEVVEKMRPSLACFTLWWDCGGWHCVLHYPLPVVFADAPTAPLAVCRAALLALQEVK